MHNISWDSKTWLGNGWFHGRDSIVEDTDLDADKLSIFLSGVNSSLISAVLSDTSADNTGSLYLVFFDSDWDVIADPYLLFTGNIDAIEISEQSKDTNIEIAWESALSVLDKASNIRWTDKFQQTRFSGDKGFEFVQKLQEDGELYWGKKKTKTPKKKDRRTKKSEVAKAHGASRTRKQRRRSRLERRRLG